MPNLLWLLSAAPSTHYEILGDVLEELVRAISEEVSIWGISWNTKLPGRSYEMHIWNGRGRLVGFQGNWSISQITEKVEHIWKLEGFQPDTILHSQSSWGKKLTRRWSRRFSAKVIPGFPFATTPPLYLAGGYSQDFLFSSDPSVVSLFVQREGAQEAAFLADLLALEKYQVIIVGTPKEATPLRSVEARFPSRVYLRLSSSWMDTALYLMRSEAVIAVGKPFGEEILIQVGRPWIAPAEHPLSAHAHATYDQIESIPALLRGALSRPAALTIEEFMQRLRGLIGWAKERDL
ncbi:MAG: hypothetical protein NZZ60_01970 [Bacteroidia bacterium]|nr:hypothetical protein [Bacteroidia bacterium]MDW8416596.1 hypothetical protein [Bacteroidia bacterium]